MSWPSSITIIGISGKIGTGKDHAARLLRDAIANRPRSPNRPLVFAFASTLKVNTAWSGEVPFEELGDDKTVRGRLALQSQGRAFKIQHGADAFVRYSELWIRQLRAMNDFDCVVIPDVRFPWELQWIESHGGLVIRLDAPQRNEHRLRQQTNGDKDAMAQIRANLSETALDECTTFAATINNDPDDERALPNHVQKLVADL